MTNVCSWSYLWKFTLSNTITAYLLCLSNDIFCGEFHFAYEIVASLNKACKESDHDSNLTALITGHVVAYVAL